MKKSLVTIVAVGAAVALMVGQASAANTRPTTLRNVTVVMHDPGCHWFSVGGKFLRTLSIKGPVSLANFDEKALKIVGPMGVQRAKVGKRVTLVPGSYVITMVGQAPDDNTLRLFVR